MPKTCPGLAITKEWLFQQLELHERGSNVMTDVSPFAIDAFQWFWDNDFDRSLHPHQTVSAEAIATYLYKLYNLLKKE